MRDIVLGLKDRCFLFDLSHPPRFSFVWTLRTSGDVSLLVGVTRIRGEIGRSRELARLSSTSQDYCGARPMVMGSPGPGWVRLESSSSDLILSNKIYDSRRRHG